MKIYIGADHAGYEFKKKLKEYLTNLGLGYEVEDMGAFTYDEDDDYPDFVRPVAEAVAKDEGNVGIVLGGSGQGEAMCANRVPGIRAALFYGEALPKEAIDVQGEKSADLFEIVKIARVHNNANILSLGVRFLSEDEAKYATELFLKTEFKGEERHIRRINKLG
ncbi:ribose-5-phosphate isomerase [Candidatus Nomurabacteria bacterium RIFCSPHIGHO2_02_FULL_41_18]|uniref:Ribose-5-phosphate isomerase n=1 Tax=Candidatus Nomurabacteria bacterium RIFCSPHIGHO2_02_FULL_41_18 TaxID=1801754 RepID=A0A1F6W7N0_9BACT|nr:MAG: ribose-5-phosphate isomerase [Candidatus Nomurabacteria bacterium RIFCSPHIGHO2_01_FULL_41_71]OGI77786.1 MAG: ribose-5-phosphate isomerase [Candidatus Nomurabacteria bacterium RIFCSPHIGHO2_02_FULL_41_18]OGI89948.1 MAG: ribose-5-phosphate isomerase [Candidatus Nomurabacteria bacterium RIFCSPLOWO2_01_FULL_41_52b]OGJ00344.1 MAG: ribose-5-phosphate isomerase [Candidatus Nomurabacteria bacterium RIFCSPLOWO2_02_FULL_41_9]